MKADLILSGKINKQLIHHEQNEKNSTDDTGDCRGGFAVAAKLQRSAARGSLKSIARIIVVFFAAHAYKYKEKRKNVSAKIRPDEIFDDWQYD